MGYSSECIHSDPNFTIVILTSWERIKSIIGGDTSDTQDIGGTLYNYWIDNINSQSVPNIKIIFAGLESMKDRMPIHDRWWLSGKSGLRFGGSINGLGGMKIQEISNITANQLVNIEHQTSGFISTKQRTSNEERIKYFTVTV